MVRLQGAETDFHNEWDVFAVMMWSKCLNILMLAPVNS
jgi:hypothetical protein